MQIMPFHPSYMQDLKDLGQSLRDYIVSLENRHDDLIFYNTDTEIDEYIHDYSNGNNTILLVSDDNIIVGYIIGKIKDENWKGTQIKKIGQIEQLFIKDSYRGKGLAQKLIQECESIFRIQGATYMEISVFALNTNAQQFYQKYGFEERLIMLDKKII